MKGVNFKNIVQIGDPMQYAYRYNIDGADELVFLDITASEENRRTRFDWVKRVAENVFIPLTVGGGIRSLEDMEELLKSGADKISINTTAVNRPKLIKKAAKIFGSQFIVLSVDALRQNGSWVITTHGGKKTHKTSPLKWAKKAQDLGAGEILLNVINSDGTQEGYNIELTQQFSEELEIPTIASGGAGKYEDFYRVFKMGKADAALAASVFHYGKMKIKELKKYLLDKGIPVRL